MIYYESSMNQRSNIGVFGGKNRENKQKQTKKISLDESPVKFGKIGVKNIKKIKV